MTKVVVYWVESNKVSIEELGKINDEDRYVGAPTSIKCGTKYHKAIVRLISSEYFSEISSDLLSRYICRII